MKKVNLNLLVRIKNPVFWVAFIPTFISFIYTVLSLLGITPSIAENTITEVLLMIVSMLANIGVLVDPTTKGVGDSANAMTYTRPN